MAIDLLATDPGMLDEATCKIIDVCREDLIATSQTGSCHGLLWSVVIALSTLAVGDVQELEGVNGMISAMCTRARNISLPLLDSCIKLKKGLGLGKLHGPKRWQTFRDAAHRVFSQAANGRNSLVEVEKMSDRWSVPVASANLPVLDARTAQRLDPGSDDISKIWAA